jgi:hypothetical protein
VVEYDPDLLSCIPHVSKSSSKLTGFGMFDWNDWIANSIGATIGVVIDMDA